MEADGYRLRYATASDLPKTFSLMRRVYTLLDDKETFAVGSMGLDWFYEHAHGEHGFGVIAETEAGEMVGFLAVCFPGLSEENLGYDIGLPEKDLPAVACMDTAAVAPEHRGHHLERRMLLWAEEHLSGMPFHFLTCTVSPKNPASMRSVQSCGYRVVCTKEKYGGFLRNVLMKEI